MTRRLLTSLILLLALSACQKSPVPATETTQTLRLALTRQPEAALIHIATVKGFFAEQGLNVATELHGFGKAALQSLQGGNADVATVAETPIMFALLRGAPIKVVANLAISNNNHAVVARRTAGIGSAKDLKGKRIGYTPGTTSDFFLSSLLTANGIWRQEVLALALEPEAMQAALLAGQVDAVSIWNYPLTQIAQALGDNGLVIADPQIYTSTFNLVARQEVLAQRPLALQKLLRALIKARDFARAQPDQAQALVAQASQIEPALVRQVWEQFEFRMGLDPILLITLEDETRWAIDNRLVEPTRVPDYRLHIHFDALAAVQPAAISISR